MRYARRQRGFIVISGAWIPLSVVWWVRGNRSSRSAVSWNGTGGGTYELVKGELTHDVKMEVCPWIGVGRENVSMCRRAGMREASLKGEGGLGGVVL